METQFRFTLCDGFDQDFVIELEMPCRVAVGDNVDFQNMVDLSSILNEETRIILQEAWFFVDSITFKKPIDGKIYMVAYMSETPE